MQEHTYIHILLFPPSAYLRNYDANLFLPHSGFFLSLLVPERQLKKKTKFYLDMKIYDLYITSYGWLLFALYNFTMFKSVNLPLINSTTRKSKDKVKKSKNKAQDPNCRTTNSLLSIS